MKATSASTESFTLSNTSEGIKPKIKAMSASGNNVRVSRKLISVRAIFHISPPFKAQLAKEHALQRPQEISGAQ
jgi:hypothetical protein